MCPSSRGNPRNGHIEDLNMPKQQRKPRNGHIEEFNLINMEAWGKTVIMKGAWSPKQARFTQNGHQEAQFSAFRFNPIAPQVFIQL